MYEFVDRFFHVALPRVRDFRGINGEFKVHRPEWGKENLFKKGLSNKKGSNAA